MALDVYVGSLTRYYMGNWERAGERTGDRPGREEVSQRHLARAQGGEHVQEAVLDWRRRLAASLAGTPDGLTLDGLALDWEEAADAAYFTGRPGWDGFGSLVLWAAYAEHPALRRPSRLPEEWDNDAALLRCNAPGFRSRFSHLVRNVELWLPAPFDVAFEGEDLEGRRIVMGSVLTLSRQLADLNAATWKARPQEIAGWARRPPAPDTDLEGQARHAFAVMNGIAAQAIEHRLPIKMDF